MSEEISLDSSELLFYFSYLKYLFLIFAILKFYLMYLSLEQFDHLVVPVILKF